MERIEWVLVTDDIRQEAVERAAEAFVERGWSPRPLQIQVAIDASGLIEQLAEAIAQRDEARRGATREAALCEQVLEQLVVEREMCDRAADYIRHQPARDVVWRDGWLRDYDAHRATEPSPEPNVFGTQEVVDAITDDRAAEHSETEEP